MRARQNQTRFSKHLQKVDGRTKHAKQFRKLVKTYTDDLGGGLNEAQLFIIKRISTLTVQLELLEVEMTNGRATQEDLDLYHRCVNTVTRLLKTLGLTKGRSKKDGPTIEEYIASKRRRNSRPRLVVNHDVGADEDDA